jgi:hypothetical protein
MFGLEGLKVALQKIEQYLTKESSDVARTCRPIRT